MFKSLKNKKAVKPKSEILAAIDIGSSKVTCSIARVDATQNLRILGHSFYVTKGYKAGVITNMSELESSVLNAVYAAEQMSGHTLKEAYVSISGKEIKSQIFQLQENIEQSVEEPHIQNLMQQILQLPIPPAHKIIHALPLYYAIDDQMGIQDPRGMVGEKLKMYIHVITAPQSLIKNIMMCVKRCHLDVVELIVSGYAAGLATLVDDEMNLGSVVVDIGGANTTISTFIEGEMRLCHTIPLGGMHITNDIARGLSTTLLQAERLKTLHGNVMMVKNSERELLSVPQIGEQMDHQQQVPKSLLINIIQSRMEEILEKVKNKIGPSNAGLYAGQRVILTGGGAELTGMREFASYILGRNIRIATPLHITGLSDTINLPSFATCAGLLVYANKQRVEGNYAEQTAQGATNVFTRMMTWFKENF